MIYFQRNSICMLWLLYSSFALAQHTDKQAIDATLNAWHKAASDAAFDAYFDVMTEDAVFIGTDATEHWNMSSFKAYSKPYFDKGKAWSFTPVERHIFISATKDFAWFDELLNTQMKLCRGSGVLKKVGQQWKIVHYVLSIAVPNEQVGEVVALKKDSDNALLKQLIKN